jgi:hypothetical protein
MPGGAFCIPTDPEESCSGRNGRLPDRMTLAPGSYTEGQTNQLHPSRVRAGQSTGCALVAKGETHDIECDAVGTPQGPRRICTRAGHPDCDGRLRTRRRVQRVPLPVEDCSYRELFGAHCSTSPPGARSTWRDLPRRPADSCALSHRPPTHRVEPECGSGAGGQFVPPVICGRAAGQTRYERQDTRVRQTKN